MNKSQLNIRIADFVAVIELNNPPSNFLNGSLLRELEAALDQLETDPECKVLVITGQGTVFSPGMNLNEIRGANSYDRLVSLSSLGHHVFNRIETFTKPVIAAVNGLCLGGGTEMILACHLRIASQEASIALPEIKVGILPGFGGTQRLPRLINLGKASEMILTGASVGGEEALRIGLVNQTVPSEKLMAETMNLAQNLAGKSRFALKAGLKTIYEGLKLDLEQGLQLEVEQVTGLWHNPDMHEGLNAFFEKRKANYQ
ncbi:enoyl-CoA hydratase [Paradesulfitobacterium aromaticivorans]